MRRRFLLNTDDDLLFGGLCILYVAQINLSAWCRLVLKTDDHVLHEAVSNWWRNTLRLEVNASRCFSLAHVENVSLFIDDRLCSVLI